LKTYARASNRAEKEHSQAVEEIVRKMAAHAKSLHFNPRKRYKVNEI